MSELKKLYTARGPGDAHVLKGLLEVEEIEAVIRGDEFVPIQGGGLLSVEIGPSVWVLHDECWARAVEIAEHYAAAKHTSETVQTGGWRCAGCQEWVEPQFTDCWNCGVSRPDADAHV